MDLKIGSVAVMVEADSHNPTILHPFFLSQQNIVPPEWELAEDPVSTPPIAYVKYKQGYTFFADTHRFSVRQERPTDLLSSDVPNLAYRYTENLKHVRYTSVELSISSFLDRADGMSFVQERFVNAEKIVALRPKSLGIRLAFEAMDNDLTLTIESRRITDKAREGVNVSAIYKRPVNVDNPFENTLLAIKSYGTLAKHFVDVTNSLLA